MTNDEIYEQIAEEGVVVGCCVMTPAHVKEVVEAYMRRTTLSLIGAELRRLRGNMTPIAQMQLLNTEETDRESREKRT